ncbi:BsuBI/PstI family type II restriction endonuclease [Streptomyces sp. A012304]|uniref:BsuBI/PstI family type II restriction endonuclease n=1 Tax=Streptomyces sp. A012304 TaxID=375446 RepID=UPI0022307C72|nr:BsuBI/PstI family type II restriction endonuclease [Streptomyces sp. A012304]GKQ34441.1 hypothetical protein ALMP_09910 [Streptomyces sp. A012304]
MLRVDESVKTTSQRPRYTLDPEFVKLLDPALVGEDLSEAIKAWQDKAFDPVALSRVDELRRKAKGEVGVSARLPDGTERQLSTGESSWILKDVIEKFCPRVMLEPRVLFISQSQEKVRSEDIAFLKKIKMPLDVAKLLPDCLIVDLAEECGHFWFVEAVATGGPITESRKKDFTEWASKGGLSADKCRFLTAFEGRGHGPARSRYRNSPATLTRGTSTSPTWSSRVTVCLTIPGRLLSDRAAGTVQEPCAAQRAAGKGARPSPSPERTVAP